MALDEYLEQNLPLIYKNEPLKYYSHNCESPTDAIALMALVDRWVEYSEILLNLNYKLL